MPALRRLAGYPPQRAAIALITDGAVLAQPHTVAGRASRPFDGDGFEDPAMRGTLRRLLFVIDHGWNPQTVDIPDTLNGRLNGPWKNDRNSPEVAVN